MYTCVRESVYVCLRVGVCEDVTYAHALRAQWHTSLIDHILMHNDIHMAYTRHRSVIDQYVLHPWRCNTYVCTPLCASTDACHMVCVDVAAWM